MGLRGRISGAWPAVRRAADRPAVVDAALAAVLLGLTLGFAGPPRLEVATLAGVAELAAVLVRHRWPTVTLAVGLVGALLHLFAGHGPVPADAAGLIGLYSVAADRGPRLSVAALCVVLAVAAGWNVYAYSSDKVNSIAVEVHSDGTVSPVSQRQFSPEALRQINSEVKRFPGLRFAQSAPIGVQLTVYLQPPVQTWGGFWPAAVVLLVVWSVGAATRRRRAQVALLRQRATELERDRDTRARLAVLDERARISREVHDAVAHGLSVVVLQAQGGAAALEHHPERTREALAAIVTTGRDALAETRRLVGALGQDESVPWDPSPGVARLPELCEQVRAAGLPLDLRVDGEPRVPPAAVDLAAYRIVQEALTNVLKHAGQPAGATVVLRYLPTTLAVEVTNGMGRDDDGATPDADLADRGTGLRGMRERATVLGGTFHAGPDQQGCFVVRATLPLEAPLT